MAAVTGLVRVRAIFVHATRAGLVMEIRMQNLVLETPDKSGPFDWKKHFDATIQVSRHQISTAQITFFRTIVAEVVNTAMFQEAAYNTADSDVLAHSGE